MAIDLRNHPFGCRPCDLVGKATSCVALSRAASRTRGARDPEHACKLFARKPGGPRGGRSVVAFGPVEEGLWPQSRRVRRWEVGRGCSICEASEQRCTTGLNRPTTGGVRGEKTPGQGELWTSDRDRHTEAGSSVERAVQSTRGSITPLRLTRGRSPVR